MTGGVARGVRGLLDLEERLFQLPRPALPELFLEEGQLAHAMGVGDQLLAVPVLPVRGQAVSHGPARKACKDANSNQRLTPALPIGGVNVRPAVLATLQPGGRGADPQPALVTVH